MKVRSEVSPEKLRGGFYSPDTLVAQCLERVAGLVGDRAGLRVLEPSAGDGAFLRGLARSTLRSRVGHIEAIEVLESEASHTRAALQALNVQGVVHAESLFQWAAQNHLPFDAAVGNPPFVRFQFVSVEDKAALATLGPQLGVSFRGVSNLWIPVLLIALSSLRNGGAFAFIVPSELFTGISARTVRRWLGLETRELEARLYPPGSFPGVLQEVIILSGRRGNAGSATLTLSQRNTDGTDERWQHAVEDEAQTWTRYLLPPVELDALVASTKGEFVKPLGTVARFEVAAVTGANDFFSVSADIVDQYQLGEWARPLLPRSRLARGLRYTLDDHELATKSGARTALLDFSPELPDPLSADGPRKYLQSGEEAGLDRRYKTRIRTPWYRVPHIRPGRLMLSKRSHRYPRLILNDADVVTTDTIYRGWMRPAYEGREDDLAAVFHNSLTMLSAEVEGRSFGGGVLELVPSEIARLAVPIVPGAGSELESLSAVYQDDVGDVPEILIERTDTLMLRHARFDVTGLDKLRTARLRLQARRLERSQSSDGVDLGTVA